MTGSSSSVHNKFRVPEIFYFGALRYDLGILVVRDFVKLEGHAHGVWSQEIREIRLITELQF